MVEQDHSQDMPSSSGKFWQSRAGIALVVFLAVAGFLLIYEHRVHVFTGYGVLVGVLALCIGMHFFMHGGQGGQGGQGGHGGGNEDTNRRGRS